MNTTIVISVTDSFWGNDPARLFNLLVHELFHNGFIRYQQGKSPNDAAEGAALLRTLIWSVQNEGLATYVGYRLQVGDHRPAALSDLGNDSDQKDKSPYVTVLCRIF